MKVSEGSKIMSRAEPFAYRWDLEVGAMIPMRGAAAARKFQDQKVYWLVEAKLVDPSDASKRQMFAVLNKAWPSLPENMRDAYPTMDALRKRALIQAGFYDEVAIEVGDAATAGRLVTSLKRQNDFSHVRIQDGHVFQRTAKSIKDMEKEEFERAKQAVFEIVAEMLGVTVEELTKQGD